MSMNVTICFMHRGKYEIVKSLQQSVLSNLVGDEIVVCKICVSERPERMVPGISFAIFNSGDK